LGLASSCCMRSAAGALAVSLGTLVAAPIVGWAVSGLLTAGIDAAASGAWPEPFRDVAVVLGSMVVAAAFAGALLVRGGLRARRPNHAFIGMVTAVTLIVPAWSTKGLSSDTRATEIFGGFATLSGCYIQCVSGNVDLDTASLLGGAAMQLFLASTIAFVAWTQADAWLGREG